MYFSLTIGMFVIKMEILNRHIGSFPEPSSVERAPVTSTKETEGNGDNLIRYLLCSTHPNRPKLFSRETEMFSLSVNYFLFRKYQC